MILITSTLGAVNRYLDRAMMKKTFGAFLNSLERQTNKNFRLFLACHDRPDGFDYPWIEWCSVMVDPECDKTKFWKTFPSTIVDEGETVIGSNSSKMEDMSRKTYHGVIRAGRWAWQNGLKEFWMLRMDSDDFLAKDVIQTIEDLDKAGVEAIYNRKCYMLDMRTGDFGEHHYPYSTTCNAIKMRFVGTELLRWYYHCTDHTLFMKNVRNDKIPFREINWTICITTNSGNHISNRPTLVKHEYSFPVILTADLGDRYGLGRH